MTAGRDVVLCVECMNRTVPNEQRWVSGLYANCECCGVKNSLWSYPLNDLLETMSWYSQFKDQGDFSLNPNLVPLLLRIASEVEP